jgi:hypothetical protein
MTKIETCWECGRENQRCNAATSDKDGKVMWVCRRCWHDLGYDDYQYEHREQRSNEA